LQFLGSNTPLHSRLLPLPQYLRAWRMMARHDAFVGKDTTCPVFVCDNLTREMTTSENLRFYPNQKLHQQSKLIQNVNIEQDWVNMADLHPPVIPPRPVSPPSSPPQAISTQTETPAIITAVMRDNEEHLSVLDRSLQFQYELEEELVKAAELNAMDFVPSEHRNDQMMISYGLPSRQELVSSLESTAHMLTNPDLTPSIRTHMEAVKSKLQQGNNLNIHI